MKLHGNQAGMVDMVLISVVLMAAIAIGGYVIYQQQQTKRAEDAAANGIVVSKHVAVKVPVATAPIKPYLNITEMGVRITLTSTIYDLDYTYSAATHTASFGSKSLTAEATKTSAASCLTDHAPLGTIVKQGKAFTATDASAPVQTKQVGTDYYGLRLGVGCPGGTYDNSDTLSKLVSNQTLVLRAAFQTIEPIQQ